MTIAPDNTHTPEITPLVTFVLFAYNQAAYVREAVQGALSQSYAPLEIVISDDCSNDGTFEAIQDETRNYTGPHKLTVRRNTANVGLAAHINKVVSLCGGELLVFAAGDDISLPGRTEQFVAEYIARKERFICLFSDMQVIDSSGSMTAANWHKPTQKQKTISLSASHPVREVNVFGCSAAYSKSLFDNFDGLHDAVIHEDGVLPIRAAILGQVVFIDKPTIKYRRHDSNAWKAKSDLPDYLSFYAIEAKQINDEVARWETLARDIARIESMALVTKVPYIELKEIAAFHLGYHHDLQKAFFSESLFVRLASCWRVAFRGRDWRLLPRFVELVLFPKIRYVRTVRRIKVAPQI